MNVKIPKTLTIYTDSVEMHEKFTEATRSLSVEKLAGVEFVWTSCSRSSCGVQASLTEIVTVKREWTGEGLPPVGVECEYLWQWSDKIVYVRIKVLSHDEERAQFRVISGGGIGSLRECNQRLEDGLPMFRPIRTPEQIAEEAKQKAVDVIEKRIMDRMGDLNVRNLAEDLFGLLGEISKPTDQ